MTEDEHRAAFTIAASAAIAALMFATERETYPVFMAWAEKNAQFTDLLTYPYLEEAARFLGAEALKAYPEPAGP